jgi:hypothetical protein
LTPRVGILGSNGVQWVRPASLTDVYAELAKWGPGEAKLTVAGTSIGIYKTETPKVFPFRRSSLLLMRPWSPFFAFCFLVSFDDGVQVIIDIQSLPELNITLVGSGGVAFGASTTVSSYIAQLRSIAVARTTAGNADSVITFEALAANATKVANLHVRNVASIAGNLVLAKTKGFISDLATVHTPITIAITR